VIIGTTWALLSPVLFEFGAAISTTIFPQLSPTSLRLAVLGLLVIVLTLSVLLYDAKSRERKIIQYETDLEIPKLMRHKKRTAEKVCPRCLITNGIVSPIFAPASGFIDCQHKGCGFRTQRNHDAA